MKKEDNWIINLLLNLFFIICFLGYPMLIIISFNNIGKYWVILINTIFLLISVYCIKKAIKNYKSKINKVENYEYYRDVNFKQINPVVAGVLLNKTKININSIFTAIFDLTEKGICNISWKENKNYISLKVHEKEKLKTLLPYEKKILYFLFENIDDEKEYALEDITKELKKNLDKLYIIKDIEKEIKKYMDNTYYTKFIDFLEKLPRKYLIGAALSYVMLIYAFPTIIASFINIKINNNILTGSTIIFQMLVGFYYGIIYSKSKLIKNKYYSEVQKVYGLYYYMSDYTFLNKQESRFYQLYDRYFVYAIGMGLADKFEKELKQESLNNEIALALKFYLKNREEIEWQ